MQLPHRLLQIGTLALFATMIGGLTLFQSGTFKPEQPLVVPDSLAPPTWLDSAKFRDAMVAVKRTRMYSSKIGLVLDDSYFEAAKRAAPAEKMAYGDTTFGWYQQPLAIKIFLSDFSKEDTLEALNVFRMRQELTTLSLSEALDFQMQCQGWAYAFRGTRWTSVDDSLQVWRSMSRSRRKSILLPEDATRFQAILDSLLSPRMMSSKSGLVFPQPIDSTEALKILAAEKLRQ